MKSAVDIVIEYFQQKRCQETFTDIFASTTKFISDRNLQELKCARQRRMPSRFDTGSVQHVSESPEDYYRREFYEVTDTAITQLQQRFDQPGIKHCIMIEKCLLDPDGQGVDLNILNEYPNINLDSLRIELKMFRLKHQFSTVVEAATILSILTPECRGIFKEIEKLVRLLLALPSSSAEAERSISSLRRLKTWLRSTMTQARLHHVCILHIHSDLVDNMDLHAIARDFITKNTSRQTLFAV
jgi:hypothetical protein